MNQQFLPVSRFDMEQRGWSELDFLMVSGDAYVDHPSFGPALLGRLLEAEGYRVGIIAQPDLDQKNSLLDMGLPRLAVLVASGVVDSMVDNYTAARKPRSEDRYSPGGKGGSRPDRATIRYCNLVREQMGEIPLIIGGIEASLRRLAHYDYWDHKVRRSILQDSQADMIVYGMGELTLLEIARLLDRGVPVRGITDLKGTCVLARQELLPKKTHSFIVDAAARMPSLPELSQSDLDLDRILPYDSEHVMLPDYQWVAKDKQAYALAFRMLYLEQDPKHGRILIQGHGQRWLVQNPPQRPLNVDEMDRLYQLPYARKPHPQYAGKGGVPAIAEVGLGITSHRGCFGGCHFCAIALHQGRIIQHRSEDSIVREAGEISRQDDFKGYIHDIGGPTANFHRPVCSRQRQGTACRERQCLFPEPCPVLEADHQAYMQVLERVRSLEGIKKVFIRSGIRFDFLLLDQKHDFLTQLCQYHISGQLKVAPEHTSRQTLSAMGKPPPEIYETFSRQFEAANKKLGKEQYLVPYLISGHPGCTLDEAIALALQIKKGQVIPEQVQDFYPTPGTISTTMYYTGLDPMTMQPVYVPRGEEKTMQRALLQYNRPANRRLVEKALHMANRTDLIGNGAQCLISAGYTGQPRSARPKSRSRKPGGTDQAQRHIKGTTKKEDKSYANNHSRKRTGRQNASGTGTKSGPHQGRKQPSAGTGRRTGR